MLKSMKSLQFNYVSNLQRQILFEPSETEKAKLVFQIKNHIATFSEEELEIYKKEAKASIKSDIAEIEKLFETYEIVKNNMLQHLY